MSVDWKTERLEVESLFLNDILEVSPFCYSALKPILRRRFLTSSGIKYDESARYSEDFKFYAELLFSGARALVTSEAYYVYTTRIGEFSGRLSPHSKSTPRFDLAISASDDLKKNTII